MLHLAAPRRNLPINFTLGVAIEILAMNEAQLINRGEQFFVTEGSTRFEGECVWSWEEAPGQCPRRAYPIRVFVQSIHKVGAARIRPLSAGERLRVAKLAKQLLEAREAGCEVLLLETQ
jgi:hypothetical protein